MLFEFFIVTETLQILLRFEPSGRVPDGVGLTQAGRSGPRTDLRPMTTLFSQRVDLSENLKNSGVALHSRARNFDIYTLGFSGVTIKHSAKRGPSELIESDPIKGNLYIAGEAYDVFDVWVNLRTANPSTGQSGLSKCIAEDCLTFREAMEFANAYLTA